MSGTEVAACSHGMHAVCGTERGQQERVDKKVCNGCQKVLSAIRLRACYAMSGTAIAECAVLRDVRCCDSGVCRATRCPVLR
eukprot:846900-Rhodomonas_salina.4